MPSAQTSMPFEQDTHTSSEDTTQPTAETTGSNFTLIMDLETETTTADINDINTDTPDSEELENNASFSSTFVETDTPTIRFRRSRNLSLRRTTVPRDMPLLSVDQEDCVWTAPLGGILTMETVLNNWVKSTLQLNEPATEILIYKRKILDSTSRAMCRPTFSCLRPLKVSFSGEMGEDFGGPKREYLRLLMDAVKRNILEGVENNLMFQHSITKLEKRAFYEGGKYVVWSILQGGPGLPVLSNVTYRILIGETDIEGDIDDVLDEDVKKNLLRIKGAKQLDDLKDVDNWMLDVGLPLLTDVSEEQKKKVLDLAVKNYIYYRLHAEYTQFTEGLNSIGRFHDVIKANSEEMKKLFIYTGNNLFASTLKSCLQINYSPAGSNKKVDEDDTVYSFESFLQDCEDGNADVRLQDLLCFWTGAEEFPPLGLHKKLEINFTNRDVLPVAHTCELSIELTRGEDPDKFKKKMTMAVQWGGEFHLA